MVHILNDIGTYGGAYGVDPADISTIGTFYATSPACSIPMAFNDATWEKYAIGEYLGLDDPATGRPTTRNLYNAAEDIDRPRWPSIGYRVSLRGGRPDGRPPRCFFEELP